MAYATKYLFKWESVGGTTREIRVLKDGYSGSVIQRSLGRAPVLKKQQNGVVFGTSLEFYAECAKGHDGEFTEFYTTDPKAFKVELYAGNTLLWQGYISPELYSEPDIAPPYDVQVVATDGIGELKLYDFAPQGLKTLRQMFTYLLGPTGLGTDVYLISSLQAASSGAGALLDKTINLDYRAGDSCYEVLTYLLDTLHATITWWQGAWIVARETNVTFSSGKVNYYNTSGNAAQLAGSVQALGAMGIAPAWPVGYLSRKVDPAKKSVTVQASWHPVSAFVNGEMDSDAAWTKTNNASWNSTKKGYNLPDNGQTPSLATVSQNVSMGGIRVPMAFVGKFCASIVTGSLYNGIVGVAVDYVTSGGAYYHVAKDGEGIPTWTTGQAGNTYDFQLRLSAVDTDESNAEQLELTIPALAVGSSYPSGTLTVRIVGRAAIVFSAALDIIIPKGYQDRLHLDNGARGEGSDVEVAIGRETSDIDYYKAFMQGILLDSGSLITSFKDAEITTGMDFLSFISRDYARSFAIPRIVRTGIVYLESAVEFPPLVLTGGGLNYWLETWTWNMREDELEISARQLPTASITVDSEVISEASGTTSGSSHSGGSSMSGYSLPLAANGTRGGLQVGYTQSGKNYPVQLDGEKAYVNVPWTDTDTWRPLGTGANDACAGNDSRLSDARPASDVYAWAKAANKPSYNLDEVSDGSTRKLANYVAKAGDTMSGPLIIALANALGLKLKRSETGSINIDLFPDNQETHGWRIGAYGSADNYMFRFTYDGADKAYLMTNGALQIAGDLMLNSDATKKTNLKDIVVSLEQIANAPAVAFDWKDGGHSFGSIAQYWKPIVPESVHGKEGNLSVAYSQLDIILIINLAREVLTLRKELERIKEK